MGVGDGRGQRHRRSGGIRSSNIILTKTTTIIIHTHPLNISFQYTLSLHPINAPYPRAHLTHPCTISSPMIISERQWSRRRKRGRKRR